MKTAFIFALPSDQLGERQYHIEHDLGSHRTKEPKCSKCVAPDLIVSVRPDGDDFGKIPAPWGNYHGGK